MILIYMFSFHPHMLGGGCVCLLCNGQNVLECLLFQKMSLPVEPISGIKAAGGKRRRKGRNTPVLCWVCIDARISGGVMRLQYTWWPFDKHNKAQVDLKGDMAMLVALEEKNKRKNKKQILLCLEAFNFHMDQGGDYTDSHMWFIRLHVLTLQSCKLFFQCLVEFPKENGMVHSIRKP